MFKSLSRTLLALGLVSVLLFSHADQALAARSGGRIGGSGGFRSVPSRSYRQPVTRYPSGGGYYPGGGYGGGFGFPFLIPFLGIGGGFGGLFTILIFIALANFLVSSFRRSGSSDESLSSGDSYTNPSVSVARLQVGLLAEARDLQAELNQIAETANTGSVEGLDLVLQETVLALLRHPEYWAYASSETQQSQLETAEEKFNRMVLAERSKLQAETLSNVNQQLKSAKRSLPETGSIQSADQGPGEYIIVTLLVAAQANLKLPQLNSSQDLRQTLNQLGAVSSDQLLALEVLWEPQAEGDTLTSEELIAEYPNLKTM